MAKKKGGKERDQSRSTSLEKFLIACQKSLARSAASASEAGKSESEFAEGERPVYVIEGLDVDLSAGVRMSMTEGIEAQDRIWLDFEAPAEQRSRLRFRVEARAVEVLSGAKLELARLDPLGEELPLVRLRVWLVDDSGIPVPAYPVVIHFSRAGDKRRRALESIEVHTDVVGRVDFYVETNKAERNLKVVGVRTRKTVHVIGSGRGKGADDFYVWASSPRNQAWNAIAEPTAPRPPHELVESSAEQTELTSELLRIRIG